MSDLEPCPHCGSKAQINKPFGLYQVGCTNLFCPYMTRLCETETEAIEAWNRKMEIGKNKGCLEPCEHRCDTCRYEKSQWFVRCADCFDYELWEKKE